MSGFLDMTPLHIACQKGYLECVRLLVEAGADMGSMGYNINGSTPLHLAAEAGHGDVCRYMVSKGASLTVQGKWTTEGTPLHVACQNQRLDAVEALCELGSDIEQKDLNGLTAMHTSSKVRYA